MSHPFDQHYFHGGGKVGGYAREGYADFNVHWTTYAKLMELKPDSVLELGCAKGYVLKRLEDSGVRVQGFDISEHCRLTRAIENVATWDITKTPWPIEDASFDLCFSISVLEHIPEDKLPAVFAEMVRTCKRGLHGIDYLEGDDGFDQTHVSLHDERWWRLRLPAEHTCVEAKTLEAGPVPTPLGNGVKLNLGSFTNCFHYSWKNIDVINVGEWARPLGYQFIHHDVKNGLPFDDEVVHFIFCVKPGALVRTRTGMKAIESVAVGDYVLTHKGRWRRVRRTFERQVKNEVVTNFTGSCLPFTITGNHEVFVQPHTRNSHNRLAYVDSRYWIPAASVRTNDRLLLPMPTLGNEHETCDLAEFIDQSKSRLLHNVIEARRKGLTYKAICKKFGVSTIEVRKWTGAQEGGRKSIPKGSCTVSPTRLRQENSAHEIRRRVLIDENFGRFLGYMFSDGWSSGPQLGIVFGAHQKEFAVDAGAIVEKLFQLTGASIRRVKNTWTIRWCSSLLAKIMKKLMESTKGNRSKKMIPADLLQHGSLKFFKGLIVGLWRGDGTIGNNIASYTTIDIRLAYQIQEILYRLGIASRIGQAIPKRKHGGFGKFKNRKIRYGVQVTGSSLRLLTSLLGMPAVKMKRMKSRSFVSNHGIETPAHVKRQQYTGPVYNIEVEEDNSYTLNGVAVHNCSHMIEHLTYDEGAALFKECHRVLKTGGLIRVLVPDAKKLIDMYAIPGTHELRSLNEMSDTASRRTTDVAKLYELLCAEHHALYDWETMEAALKTAGFSVVEKMPFRRSRSPVMQRETMDMYAEMSLIVEAVK